MGGRGGRGEQQLWQLQLLQDSEAQKSCCCSSVYHGQILIDCLIQGTWLYALVIPGFRDQCVLAGCFHIDPEAQFYV